jgi:hypothetical protein
VNLGRFKRIQKIAETIEQLSRNVRSSDCIKGKETGVVPQSRMRHAANSKQTAIPVN